MAINLLNGQLLNSTLARDGVNLAIANTANSTPTLYVDVGNTFIGINTNTPTQSLTVGGNAIANNLFSSNNVSVGGNVLGVNLSVSGNVISVAVSASGNVNGNNLFGNLVTAQNISVSGNITTGNIVVNQTGILNLANLSITNTTISSTSAGNLVTIGGTSGLVLPAGNTAQRPVSPLTGTTRFNTTVNNVEAYDGSAWITGSGTPNSIADQQITPDGASTAYTLSQPATTDSVIVSINGIVQLPGVAYTVSGTTITFNQIPLITDIIDVRTIAVQGQSLQLPSYNVTQALAIPSPSNGQIIYVYNGDAGSPSLAVYDGTSWKRVALGATISAT